MIGEDWMEPGNFAICKARRWVDVIPEGGAEVFGRLESLSPSDCPAYGKVYTVAGVVERHGYTLLILAEFADRCWLAERFIPSPMRYHFMVRRMLLGAHRPVTDPDTIINGRVH